MLLAGSTRFLSLGVSRSGRREAAAPRPRNGANAHRMHSSVVSRFPRRCSKLCWVRTRAAQEPGEPPPQGRWRARARRTQKAEASASLHPHTSPAPPLAAVPPTQAPSFQWPSLVIFQGVQQPRQDARAFPPQPVTAEEKPHAPGLAQPAALWSQGWSAAWDKHARALAQATAPGHCSMFGCQRTAFRNG